MSHSPTQTQGPPLGPHPPEPSHSLSLWPCLSPCRSRKVRWAHPCLSLGPVHWLRSHRPDLFQNVWIPVQVPMCRVAGPRFPPL